MTTATIDIPAGWTFVSSETEGYHVNEQDVSWKIGTLYGGNSSFIKVRLRSLQPLIAGQQVLFNARITNASGVSSTHHTTGLVLREDASASLSLSTQYPVRNRNQNNTWTAHLSNHSDLPVTNADLRLMTPLFAGSVPANNGYYIPRLNLTTQATPAQQYPPWGHDWKNASGTDLYAGIWFGYRRTIVASSALSVNITIAASAGWDGFIQPMVAEYWAPVSGQGYVFKKRASALVLLDSRTNNTRPAAPSITSPSAGATNVPLTPQITASGFFDSDGGTHATSQWIIRNAATATERLFDSDETNEALTSLLVPVGILNYQTIYTTRVRYRDSGGQWSEWSPVTNFTTQNAPASGPVSLKIERTGGMTQLSWPVTAGGFVLETTTTLTSSNWETLSDVPAVIADRYVVTKNWSDFRRFFRLRER